MNLRLSILCVVIAGYVFCPGNVSACTIFTAALQGKILAGNNEDWYDSNSKICFYPSEQGKYGRFIFRDLYGFPQGGMNDQGLFYDIAAHPQLNITSSLSMIPIMGRDILTKCLEECATVREVKKVFDKYNLSFMAKWQIMWADSTRASIIIEGDDIIEKEGDFQVMTNFVQSATNTPYTCTRYNTAVNMLEDRTSISVELFRDICDATHQVHDWYTQYSNVCDLKNKTIYLYHKYNFDEVVKIDLLKELEKGEKSYLISSYMVLMNSPEAITTSPVNLLQNYPNPFSSNTTISFSLPYEEHATLKIYDLNGREIAILFNEIAQQGINNVNFTGSYLPQGLYIYAIETKRYRLTRKMNLVK